MIRIIFFLLCSFGFCFLTTTAEVKPLLKEDYFKTLTELIKEAKKEIRIMLFSLRYYDKYPHSQTNILINSLIEASKKGVDVEILLDDTEGKLHEENSLKNLRAAKRFLGTNVKVFLDSPDITTHDKLIIIDDKVIIGSFNWTYHGLEKNNESAVLIISKQLADFFKEYFERIKKTGYRLFR